MTAIENLHLLDIEVRNLEEKYQGALDALIATRITLYKVLYGIKINNIQIIKDILFPEDWDSYKKDMESCDGALDLIEQYKRIRK